MRKVLKIKQCMQTFEGDGIPVTRALVTGMPVSYTHLRAHET